MDRESLKDLQNEPYTVSSIEEDEQIQEALDTSRPKEVEDGEALQALGAEEQVGDLTIPPPTTGVLMLLQIIESPFVVASEELATLQDVLEALYIIHNREDALNPILGCSRAAKAVGKYWEKSLVSDAHFEKFLAVTAATSGNFAEFDREVIAFAHRLGVIDLESTRQMLDEYIGECFGGYELFPPADEKDDKKKVGSEQSGSQE